MRKLTSSWVAVARPEGNYALRKCILLRVIASSAGLRAALTFRNTSLSMSHLKSDFFPVVSSQLAGRILRSTDQAKQKFPNP